MLVIGQPKMFFIKFVLTKERSIYIIRLSTGCR